MYKILCDENIPLSLVKFLKDLEYKVDIIWKDYPSWITDDEVFDIINACKYDVFLTYDKDFWELLFYRSYYCRCKKIYFILIRSSVEIFVNKIGFIFSSLDEGKKFIVVTKDKIRIVNINWQWK